MKDYEIATCNKCIQMTNHLDGICQKCTPAKEMPPCQHFHCRCMNIGGQCLNFHYADCLRAFNATTPAKEWREEFDKEWLQTGCNSFGVATKGVVKDMFGRLLDQHSAHLVERMEKEKKGMRGEVNISDHYKLGFNQALDQAIVFIQETRSAV